MQSGSRNGVVEPRVEESWVRFAPKCEICEWTMETLEKAEIERGLPIPPFVREAVSRRKWAFAAGQWMPNGSVVMEPAIIALEKGSPIAKAMLDYYETAAYDGTTTVGTILEGQVNGNRWNLRVLPPEALSPIDVNGVCHRTDETRGIHHYAMGWATPQRKIAKWLAWHGMRKEVEMPLSMRRKRGRSTPQMRQQNT